MHVYKTLLILSHHSLRQSIMPHRKGQTSSSAPFLAQAAITVLPEEIIGKIMQLLYCRDICRVALALKAMYHWANTMSTISGLCAF